MKRIVFAALVIVALVLAGCASKQPGRPAPTAFEEGQFDEEGIDETAYPEVQAIRAVSTPSPVVSPALRATPLPDAFAVNRTHPIAERIILALTAPGWSMFNYPLDPSTSELSREGREASRRFASCKRVTQVIDAMALSSDRSGSPEPWRIPGADAGNSGSAVDCNALAQEKKIICCKAFSEDGGCVGTFNECGGDDGFVFRYGNQFIWVGHPIYSFLRDSATIFESMEPIVQESLGNPQAAARVFNSLKAGCRSLESKYSVYIDIDDAEFACDDERVESHLSTGLNNTRLPLIVRFVQEGTGSEFSWMADFRGVDAG